MFKKDQIFRIQDLGYFRDKNSDIHFAVICDDAVFDIRDEVLRPMSDDVYNDRKIVFDPCFKVEESKYVSCKDSWNLLTKGLPNLEVDPEYLNFRLYFYQSRLEDFANRTEFTMAELEKINKWYAKFYEIQNKIFQKHSNKVFMSAKRNADRDNKREAKAKAKEDKQEKDM